MQDLIAAHAHSSNHRDEITAISLCGCFHCLTTFSPSKITEWIDSPQDAPDDREFATGTTALCPNCGVDAVIGSACGYAIEAELLVAMRRHWF